MFKISAHFQYITLIQTNIMGRKYKSNKFAQKRRERKRNQENVSKPIRTEGFQDIIKENDKFVRFYQHMGICPVNEWDSFLQTLRTNLPTTFRISSCRKTAKRLLDIIQSDFFDKYVAESTLEGSTRPFSLPWYPNGLAWQLDLTRKDIRRSESHYKLHNFLIAETTAGSISRKYQKIHNISFQIKIFSPIIQKMEFMNYMVFNKYSTKHSKFF